MTGLNSFRIQLLLLVIGLFSLVLLAVFFAVNQANESNARLHIEETLSITAVSFKRSLAARNQILLDKARLLSADFAFKEAVATNDHETTLSALENHRQRVKASIMMLASLDGELIANTLHPEQDNSTPWLLKSMQRYAENSEEIEAGGIQLLDEKPYQLVLMPLMMPEPSAWIVIGFRIDERFTQRLAEQTNSQVSLLYKSNNSDWQFLSTTLKPTLQSDLLENIQKANISKLRQVTDIPLDGDTFLSMGLAIQGSAEGKTLAVLQRSLPKALIPYLRLREIMLALFAFGLLVAVISAFLIARSLGRPIEALTRSVKRIDAGDYKKTITLKRNDELGTLSAAIKNMAQGLMERDQVRNLLGKVVSPEIASELLSKEIELGGEERGATILFSDIRGFTQLCEFQKPKDILTLLNRYLSSMSLVIEDNHGVIDKYIGDAIMALFGVPIDIKKNAERAVKAAIGMIESLDELNSELNKEGINDIKIGIGINTGQIVAGNMGAPNRLNYTVLGDNVNLASRLESLTRYFGVPIIVSETTAKQCKSIHFRELGIVQVKGKAESIKIFEPLSLQPLSKAEETRLKNHHTALNAFRNQQWDLAQQLFQRLLTSENESDIKNYANLYQLYLDNILNFRKQKLDQKWQGELVFSQK